MKKFLTAALMLGAASAAQAAAILDNGTIMIGVGDYGQLNVSGGPSSPVEGTTAVGLRDLRTGYEATSHGCQCEGWGVSVNGLSGGANNSTDGSPFGALSLSSFSFGGTGTSPFSAGSNATSVTTLGGALRITHTFTPSVNSNLFQVNVNIENISGEATTNLLYRRAFDWDIEPTAFNEYSTIQGTALAANVILANDNGFCSSNPLAGCSGSFSGDFIDAGPTDHGAVFGFDFGALAAGGSYSFNIYYGAAPTEAAALSSLGAVGGQIYSFGQASNDRTGGNGSTFIFGFDGVGGVVVNPGVPEPGIWAQLIVGFGLAGVAARRRRRATVAA
ncbi:PEPxxWA-CTERM sorting domain-containing protein [Sandarakinorhabdus sp. DWP1-3-1]|uniref:PEPxxWA-CTERM sorting domain-containing protein n=1 Tax=Sandarakinorhabdus sp. DWP1-3-1 TaxID=2804627 RepID=UPI003CF109F9